MLFFKTVFFVTSNTVQVKNIKKCFNHFPKVNFNYTFGLYLVHNIMYIVKTILNYILSLRPKQFFMHILSTNVTIILNKYHFECLICIRSVYAKTQQKKKKINRLPYVHDFCIFTYCKIE